MFALAAGLHSIQVLQLNAGGSTDAAFVGRGSQAMLWKRRHDEGWTTRCPAAPASKPEAFTGGRHGEDREGLHAATDISLQGLPKLNSAEQSRRAKP